MLKQKYFWQWFNIDSITYIIRTSSIDATHNTTQRFGNCFPLPAN